MIDMPAAVSSLQFAAAKVAVANMYRRLVPRVVRTFRQFAEEEIILPSGPREGEHFRCEDMPDRGACLDAFTDGHWKRYFATGPTQTGKTFAFFIIPILWHLFENEEDVIVGVPVMDLAHSIWEKRIKKVIDRTRYKTLLPSKGRGSRGGTFSSVTFNNGVNLMFMAAGGGDIQRSSETARVIVLTELDKMDESSATSKETDSVGQLEARSNAFGDQARIYGECTVSTDKGRIWVEVTENGTETSLFMQCPDCKAYSCPEREHFTGWQDAKDEIDARESARVICPECGVLWDEDDREKAMQKIVLVHRGQKVNKRGKVTGDEPRTVTFGMRWHALHSPLRTLAVIAEEEYRAERADTDDARKKVTQFTWALPWEGELLDISGVTAGSIMQRSTNHARGVVPDGVTLVTCCIDVGKWQCHWTGVGWRPDHSGYVIDYGGIEVHHNQGGGEEHNILNALRQFRDDTLVPGWGDGHRPAVVLVDCGWKQDVAYTFCKESGNAIYYPSKGFGTARNQPSWNQQPRQGRAKGIRFGDNWRLVRDRTGQVITVQMHTDYWKSFLHQRLLTPMGQPGALSLPSVEHAREHHSFAKHLTAEVEVEEFVAGKGAPKKIWKVKSRNNHWFDATYANGVAASMKGIRLLTASKTEAPVAKAAPKRKGGGAWVKGSGRGRGGWINR